jgi:hypothetical protein
LCQINVEDGDDVLNQRKLNNPLALLADASKSAQSVELAYSADSRVQESITVNIAPRLLSRPGYISLGLQLDRTTLERGLETIFESPNSQELLNARYFKPIYQDKPPDVGEDLDPVDLSLISMEEAQHLFSS